MAGADGGGEGSLEADLVLVDGNARRLRKHPAPIRLLDSVDLALFPIDGSLKLIN